MTLPAPYRWADDSEGSARLYRNYGCVASVRPDGTTRFKYWQREFNAKAASVQQAKRFIERWINARNSLRAYECEQWRNRHFRARPPQATLKHAKDKLPRSTAPTEGPKSVVSSRVIKLAGLPLDLESISDIGQPLRLFVGSRNTSM